MTVIYIVVMSLSVFATRAHAYLDPGTGSMLVSAIIGAVATVLYLLRGWFYKLKKIVFRSSGEKADPVSASVEETEVDSVSTDNVPDGR